MVSGIVQLILYACYFSRKGEEDGDGDGDFELKPTGVREISSNGRATA